MSGRIGITTLVLVVGLAIWVALQFGGAAGYEFEAPPSEVVERGELPDTRPRRVIPSGAATPKVAVTASTPGSSSAGVQDEDFIVVELVLGEDRSPAAGAELFVCEPGVMGSHRNRPRLRELEPKLRTRIRPLVADDHGQVRLPRPPSGTRLFAFTPTESGRSEFDPFRDARVRAQGDQAVRVLLGRDDRRIRVRTRASDGRLLGGIPVILVRDQSKSSGHLIGQTSESDGTIEVPWPDADQRHGSWLVAVGGAFLKEIEAPIDFEAAPETIIELELPAYGHAEIEFVTSEGSPIDFPLQLGFRVAGRMSFRSLHEKVRSGRCRVGPIEAGAEFEYWAVPLDQTRGRSSGSTIAGPVRAGQVLFLRREIATWKRQLRLRALDSGGRPLAHRHLRVRLSKAGAPTTSKRTLETDAEGSLAFGFDKPDPAGANVTISLLHKGRLLAQGEVMLGKPLKNMEEVDLGEVVLEPPPLVAAGRVLDRAGRPIPFPAASLRAFEGNRWRMSRFDALELFPDGSFEIRSFTKADRLTLTVRARGKAAKSIELQPGKQDLEIIMDGASRIEGRLVLPEGRSPGDYRLEVETAEGRTSSIHIKKDGSFRSYWLDAELRAIRLHPRDRKQREHQLIAHDIVLKTGDQLDLGAIVVTLRPTPIRRASR